MAMRHQLHSLAHHRGLDLAVNPVAFKPGFQRNQVMINDLLIALDQAHAKLIKPELPFPDRIVFQDQHQVMHPAGVAALSSPVNLADQFGFPECLWINPAVFRRYIRIVVRH
ncbi:MAG: hypothetical protein MUC53_08340 [Candidatus Contendobacter sp.]|nr:hypothetical protein [Candidatus Contendobacter sp.]